MNLLLAQGRKKKIIIDGDIGRNTIAAVNLYSVPPFPDCNSLAANVAGVTARLGNLAADRARGANQAIIETGAKLPTTTSAIGAPKVSKAGFGWIGLLLLGGVGAFMYYQDKKTKKGGMHAGGWF